MAEPASPALQSEGLRERHVAQAISEEASPSVSSELGTPQNESEVEKEKKTFGRTPDGTSTLLSIMDYANGAATTSASTSADSANGGLQFSQYLKLTTWSPNYWILDSPRISPTL
jgi:hypothetical protein